MTFMDVEAVRRTVTRLGGELRLRIETAGLTLAVCEPMSGEVEFDWQAIETAAVLTDAAPLAQMLLAARTAGRDGATEVAGPSPDENPPEAEAAPAPAPAAPSEGEPAPAETVPGAFNFGSQP